LKTYAARKVGVLAIAYVQIYIKNLTIIVICQAISALRGILFSCYDVLVALSPITKE